MVICFLILASRTVSAQTVRVTVDGASIWSAPSLPSIVLTTAKTGTVLEVLARVGAWYRVRLPDDPTRVGYILVRQVEGDPGKIAVAPVPPPGTRPRALPPRRGAPRRAFVSASGGYLPGGLKFSNDESFTEFVEKGERSTAYEVQRGALLDVGYGVEVHRGFFVTGAVSVFNGSSDVDIEEQIPHPFFFNQTRTLTGTAAGLERDEIGLHFQVAGLMPITNRIHLMLGIGPSVFWMKQTVVSNVVYAQEYPFDSVTFTSVTTALREKTQVGGNIQVNVITMMTRHVGVDAFARFSRAAARFEAEDGSKFTVFAGGPHVGIGLRAEF